MDHNAWEPLLRYESRDYLAAYYKKKYNRGISAKSAHDIGSCFTQGREYFASASTASEAVKPLLLYYGVSSIGRGATLLLSPNKSEESLVSSHGLNTVKWKNTLQQGLSAILALEVVSSKGAFVDFVGSIGNRQPYVWHMDSGSTGHSTVDFGEIKFTDGDDKISLGDLLSRETELASEHETISKDWGELDIGWVGSYDSGVKVNFIPIYGKDTSAAISSYNFPPSASVSYERDRTILGLSTICIDIPTPPDRRGDIVPIAVSGEGRTSTLVRPFKNGDRIIDIHRMYLESYILGMLSRYFPSKWMSLVRSEKGDISRSLVLAAISRIERKFPQLLRQHLV